MSKNGIYITTKRPLMGYNKNEERVFNFLLKCTDSATQTQIAQKLDMSRSTVIRTLDRMQGKEFPSKGLSYTIICENKKYSMLKKEKTTKGLENSATLAQEEEFTDRFGNATENLSMPNKLFSTTAERISDNIVYYQANTKYSFDIKSSVLQVYNDDIYDIATGDKGIYIVIKNDEEHKIADKIINSLENLYKESIKKRNLNYHK